MDIDTVAHLARIALDGDESSRYAEELKGVLSLMATLDELDLSQVAPMRHVVPIDTPYRDDIPGETLPRDRTLANAPAHDGEAFVVPKVV
jgi:aspartyl-tRNA(Asn)/glutamyl-tRNA(Gln) amidotransferase subunit C